MIKAVEDIKKFARTYQGILDLAAKLEEIGSLENYEKEVRARVSKAEAEEKKAVASMNGSSEKLQAIEASCMDLQMKASQEALEVLEKANAEAEEVKAKAKEKANALLEAANDSHAKILASVEVLKAERSEIRGEVSAAKVLLSDINEQIKDLKARFK